MNFLWIQTNKKNQNRLLLRMFKKKIPIYDTREENDLFFLKISFDDFDAFQKNAFVRYQIRDETGFLKVKKELKKYHIFLISCLLGAILFYFLTHIMVQVEVIHSNKEIRDLIASSLEQRGIKKNSWRKKYHELEQIKEEILHEYPNQLEWLEIEVKGMNYIVRVEERKIISEPEEKKQCHIVARKDGIVKKLIYSKGEAVVKTNDYVKQGDLLISGELAKDEETKNVVCASGKVYAEVWYKVKIDIPKTVTTNKETGKVRWNLKYKTNQSDDFIFKSRIETYVEESHFLFQLFGMSFSFVKQKEVQPETYTYSEEELERLALKEALEKVKQTLDDKEEILTQKILKKEVGEDHMKLEIFVSVLEQIGQEQEF